MTGKNAFLRPASTADIIGDNYLPHIGLQWRRQGPPMKTWNELIFCFLFVGLLFLETLEIPPIHPVCKPKVITIVIYLPITNQSIKYMYEKLTKYPNLACYMLENIYPIFWEGGQWVMYPPLCPTCLLHHASNMLIQFYRYYNCYSVYSRKVPMGYRLVMLPMTSRGPMTSCIMVTSWFFYVKCFLPGNVPCVVCLYGTHG